MYVEEIKGEAGGHLLALHFFGRNLMAVNSGRTYVKKDVDHIPILLGVLLFIGAVFFFTYPQFSRPTFGTVRRQGIVITTAIDKYKVDHGIYPDSLKRLLPKYLESISKPKLYGRQLRLQLLSRAKWEYQKIPDGNSYYLGITNSYPFGYDSQTEEWGFHLSKP